MSGCDARFPLQIFGDDDREVDQDVRELVKEASERQSLKNYLTGKDKQSKKVRSNVEDFWRKFIIRASEKDISNITEHGFLVWFFALST